MSISKQINSASPKDHVVVIVGGTGGIGKEVANQLARRGARIVIVGRNTTKGESIVAELGQQAEFVAADVSLQAECHRLSQLILQRYKRLDVLIHSADVVLSDQRRTAEGYELSFATNFVSRALLNELLLDRLKETASEHGAARIIHVGAAGFPGRLDLNDVPPGPDLNPLKAHNVGQRANDVYAVAQANQLRGTNVEIYVTFPGLFVNTDIRRRSVSGFWRPIVRAFDVLVRPFMRSIAAGAHQTIEMAVGGAKSDGVLIRPNGKPVKHEGDTRYSAELQEGILLAVEEMTSEANL